MRTRGTVGPRGGGRRCRNYHTNDLKSTARWQVEAIKWMERGGDGGRDREKKSSGVGRKGKGKGRSRQWIKLKAKSRKGQGTQGSADWEKISDGNEENRGTGAGIHGRQKEKGDVAKAEQQHKEE